LGGGVVRGAVVGLGRRAVAVGRWGGGAVGRWGGGRWGGGRGGAMGRCSG